VTTIENAYPFLSYIEEADGPAGLAARGEVAVYTAGFPTPRLVTALVQKSNAVFQHWGDADVGGLRIWYFLRSRLGYPLMLLRTTARWVASGRHSGADLYHRRSATRSSECVRNWRTPKG
jgi:Wadjet anti plasmid transformation system JetA-like protein